MERISLTCAETAKLARAALKKAFPRVKFSVRSDTYSGGASMRVNWDDGPTAAMVEAVAKQFQGGGFDGMIDMQWHQSHWLMPDGSTTVATREGTEGSRGTVGAVREWMPHPDAKLVRFGADFVFCERRLSAQFLRQACRRLVRKGFVQFDGAEVIDNGRYAYLKLTNDTHELNALFRRETVNLMIV